MNTFRVLIIEDDEQVRQFLTECLSRAGYDVKAAATGRAALAMLETTMFDAALLDIHLPDMLGIEVLEFAKRRDPDMDVVIMTGFPEVETAVQALRLGAYDYLIKPLEWLPLHQSLKRIIERRYLRQEVTSLRSELASAVPGGELIGSSAAIQQIRHTIERVAPTDTAVLIEGESGTGKELVATAIHKLSSRASGPFVAINCAAIPSDLIESELFGHQKGSFSGATSDSRGLFRSADGGTLFLDEIGEMPLHLQPKLLRVLQEKEVRPVGSTQVHRVDIRVIAATNQKLEAAVQSGKFRQDLYFRLNVVRIEPPALRQMKEDIPALVLHFIRKLNRKFGRQVTSVTPDGMAALTAYDFPGNIRELENILERAYALGATGEIKLADLPLLIGQRKAAAVPLTDANPSSLDNLERELILATLRTHENDKEKTAQSLGMSERTLYRRLKKLGVSESRPLRQF
jgi:DNA-binding NtrC family response regulator